MVKRLHVNIRWRPRYSVRSTTGSENDEAPVVVCFYNPDNLSDRDDIRSVENIPDCEYGTQIRYNFQLQATMLRYGIYRPNYGARSRARTNVYLQYIPSNAPFLIDIFVMSNNMSYWPEYTYVATINAQIVANNINS